MQRSTWSISILAISIWIVVEPKQRCPPGCNCIGQTISCIRTGFSTIPQFPRHIPDANAGILQFLMLSQNPLTRIEPNSFDGHRDLIRIEISYSQIIWIDKEAFFGLENLRSLSLRGNRISSLPDEVFVPIYKLEDLDLSRNQLVNLPFSLEGLIYLKRISLFGNPLHCPCVLVDFAQNLVHLELKRARVICHTPTQVTHQQLSVIGNRMKTAVTSTRLMGYQALNDSDRGEYIRTQPFVPRPNELQHAWPWPHCPIVDFGGYEPRLSESHSTSQESPSEAFSEFVELPEWRTRPQSIEVVAGDVAHFICGANNHQRSQITWILPANATKFIRLYRRRQILEITETHDYHEGIYTCLISNKNGQHLYASANLRLVNPVKPSIVDAPPADDNLITEGSDLELRCTSHGRPRPKISWLWQEETLPMQLVTGGRYIVRSRANVPTGNLRVENLHVYWPTQQIIAESQSTVTESVLLIRNITKNDAHGKYICYSSNRVGSARISTVIRVLETYIPRQETDSIDQAVPKLRSNNENNEVGELSGDELVKHVIEKARVRIEAAIKKTAERLRDPNRHRSSSEVASLFRQPSRAALELAKAAEVYEAAIDEVTSILRQRSQQKLELNDTIPEPTPDEEAKPHSREALGVQLTVDQLAIISQLSGCQESSNIDPCSHQLCFHLKYRSIDGACNNFIHPRWGAALVPFKRLLSPQYENGINTPIGWTATRLYFGYPKPSARLVSREMLGDATLIGRHITKLKMLREWRVTQEKHNNMSNDRYLTNRIDASEFQRKKDQFDSAKSMHEKFIRESGRIYDEDEKYSGMLMQWGQFLDHDLDFTPVDASISRFSDGLNCNETCLNDPPCFPILIPPGDPRIKHRCIGFARSSATCGSGSTSILLGKPHHREQLNQITSFIDASNVYGSDEFENGQLRETLHDEGKMRMGMPTPSGRQLLPFNIRGQVDCQADPQQDFVPCFKAGDHRSNENLGLLSMHTLWVREHNRIADVLRTLNTDWFGDRVYHETRKIVGACMQAITYEVWLPMILGPEGFKMIGSYHGYDDQVNPTISNEFATAAMRFGHTLVAPILFRLGADWEPIEAGHLPLHQAFFAPERMLKDGGMDPIIRGLLFNGVRDRARNPPLNVELTERLFSMAHELALDLAALNVQRGRDHGLPSYTEYAYKFCGLGKSAHPNSFDELESRISNPETREKLRRVYGHPGNIDLFTGGVLEDLLPGARVGPTFACIMVDQFKRLRDGDRFWYESRDVFTPAQLAEIRRAGSSLSRVICQVGDNITEVPKNAFFRPIRGEDLISCTDMPELNLAAWVECSSDSNRFQTGPIRQRRSVPESACPSEGKHIQRESTTTTDLEQKLIDLQNNITRLTETVERLSRGMSEL